MARRIIKEKGWTRQDFDLGENPENFKLLNVSILQEYQKILAANEKSNALFDRGPDALVYIRYYLGEEEYQKAIETEYVQYCIERYLGGFDLFWLRFRNCMFLQISKWHFVYLGTPRRVDRGRFRSINIDYR